MIRLLFRHPWLFRLLMSLYPPFLGAGVRVRSASRDLRDVEVQLRMRIFNRNAMGTHFGGSLYAMTDPFYVLMFIANLGPGYEVWDRSARIQFQRPGRGVVSAHFHLDEEDLRKAREAVAGGAPYTPVYTVKIRDRQGRSVATIRKELYIRRRGD